MTKAKLTRLIELERTCSRIGDLVPGPIKREIEALRAEFAAWEPDQERDEARRAVHEIIDSVTSVVDGAAGQKIWSWAVQKWTWLREIADQ